jgi:hypothetical protein
MPHTYIPILKAKQGELRALTEASPRTRLGMTPLIEITDARPADQAAKVQAAARGARVLVDVAAGIDAQPADDDEEFAAVERTALAELLRALRDLGAHAAPVVRVSDPLDVLEQLRAEVTADGQGACIRITGEDLDDAVTPLPDLVERARAALGQRPDQVDVVLDLSVIGDDNALGLSTRLARFVLPGLATQPWRSLVLASGAFPVNLSGVAPFTLGTFVRRDRALWMALSVLDLGRDLGFGDYAVTHPLLPTGAAFAAPPQLRYTATGDWLVLKGQRQDRRGHRQFYDLCAALLDKRPGDVAPADASWGDAYVHAAARDEGVGPGNASTWRAIGTSHHLAYVVSSLATRGEP